MEKIKFKKGTFYISYYKGSKKFKQLVNGKIFTYDTFNLGIFKNQVGLYSLTMIDNGMGICLEDRQKDIISQLPILIEKIKNVPEYRFKEACEYFNNLPILEEV